MQLSYATIRAPISGRISAASVKVGNFVRSADLLPIATIIQTAPVYVSFPMPQMQLPDVREALRGGLASVEAVVPGETSARIGRIAMIENTVDAATGMVNVRATMPNETSCCGRARWCTRTLKLRNEEAVTVPSAAVQVSQAGTFVFVVKDGVAECTRSRSRARSATCRSSKAASQDGETVVIDGHLQLTERHARRDPRAQNAERGGRRRMGISEACIRRPVMTTLITASLIVFGVFAYRLLSVAALPAVDFPTIAITATLAGREPGDHGGLGRRPRSSGSSRPSRASRR